MVRIGQLLEGKGNQVWSVGPQATLRDALKLMATKDIGAVLVTDHDKVVGIFSERDYARHSITEQCVSLDDPVSSVMTSSVYYINPDQTIDEGMAIMTQKHFRHLPVVKDEQVLGVVSIGDIVKWAISDKDITIRGLENFILGREYSG